MNTDFKADDEPDDKSFIKDIFIVEIFGSNYKGEYFPLMRS